MAARGRLRLAAPPLFEVEEDLRGAKRRAADQDEVGAAGFIVAGVGEAAAASEALGAAVLAASVDEELPARLPEKDIPAYRDSPLSGFCPPSAGGEACEEGVPIG